MHLFSLLPMYLSSGAGVGGDRRRDLRGIWLETNARRFGNSEWQEPLLVRNWRRGDKRRSRPKPMYSTPRKAFCILSDNCGHDKNYYAISHMTLRFPCVCLFLDEDFSPFLHPQRLYLGSANGRGKSFDLAGGKFREVPKSQDTKQDNVYSNG